jgi:hypothetical protein
MEIAHTSSNQTCANCINGTDPEKLFSKRSSSKDRPFVAANVPSTILHTTQKSEPRCLSDNMSGTSLQQPSKVATENEDTQPDRTNPTPRLMKTTCLQCRDKKLRRSDQRPFKGCGNDDLDCARDNSEHKPKRRSREYRSADGAVTKSKSTETKDTPRQVRNACTRCQHRKSKCSGTRPTCTSCTEKQLQCSYDVAEGATRSSDLKRKLRESSGRTQALGRVLAVMREGSDDQATEVFAKLRMGESLRNIVCSLPTYISPPRSGYKQTGLSQYPSGP